MSTPPPAMLLAIDPGIANGFSVWRDGKPAEHGTIRGLNKMEDWLIDFVEKYGKPDVVVYENFKLFRWKAQQQSGSAMETSQVIGKIKFWAKMNKITVVEQSPQNLSIAVKFSKMPLPKNHDVSHHISAFNHAVYYLVINGMMKPFGM